jgi:hypothetical protein
MIRSERPIDWRQRNKSSPKKKVIKIQASPAQHDTCLPATSIIIKRTAGTARREERKRNINMRKSMRLKKRKKTLSISNPLRSRMFTYNNTRILLGHDKRGRQRRMPLCSLRSTDVFVVQICIRTVTEDVCRCTPNKAPSGHGVASFLFFFPCDELIDIFTYYWTKGGVGTCSQIL